jgi:hypothetical protein
MKKKTQHETKEKESKLLRLARELDVARDRARKEMAEVSRLTIALEKELGVGFGPGDEEEETLA